MMRWNSRHYPEMASWFNQEVSGKDFLWVPRLFFNHLFWFGSSRSSKAASSLPVPAPWSLTCSSCRCSCSCCSSPPWLRCRGSCPPFGPYWVPPPGSTIFWSSAVWLGRPSCSTSTFRWSPLWPETDWATSGNFWTPPSAPRSCVTP